MIPEQSISEELKEQHRPTDENFRMNFAQLDKKMLNSKIIFSGKFMELWSVVVSSTIISFLLTIFPNSAISNNIPFVTQIEKYVNMVLTGITPQNMREYHKSVFCLVSKDVKDDFPTYIHIKEPEPSQQQSFLSPSKNLIRKKSKSKSKENKICFPRRCPPHDRSGLPIAKAAEVFKKTENLLNNYKIERTKQLFDICAQEELYIEAKEVPPITPLGITFEDFPKPHLPLDYINPRDPRRKVIKRVRSIPKQPKNAPKRRYRVIPEPEETMERIARMHEYLSGTQVFIV